MDSTLKFNTLLEIVIRVLLVLIFIRLEYAVPFERKIHPEELWLYKNPMTASYVPSRLLWPLIILIPITVVIVNFKLVKDKNDVKAAMMALSLSMGLTAVLTDTIKLIVGRPRPDYFWRCFPNGEMNKDMICTGKKWVVYDGRKSFPSGHSSLSFSSMGFVSLYLMAKLHMFGDEGRGQSCRLIVCLLPLLLALTIALSRTCDYHHHWQDVLVGSLLGMTISCLCYRQYYPSLAHDNCHLPYASFR